METLILNISGMACGGCANSVRQALLAVDGVASAEVSHAEAKATVVYDLTVVGPERLRQAIEAIGYKVD